jgi:hypothetical protein
MLNRYRSDLSQGTIPTDLVLFISASPEDRRLPERISSGRAGLEFLSRETRRLRQSTTVMTKPLREAASRRVQFFDLRLLARPETGCESRVPSRDGLAARIKLLRLTCVIRDGVADIRSLQSALARAPSLWSDQLPLFRLEPSWNWGDGPGYESDGANERCVVLVCFSLLEHPRESDFPLARQIISICSSQFNNISYQRK